MKLPKLALGHASDLVDADRQPQAAASRRPRQARTVPRCCRASAGSMSPRRHSRMTNGRPLPPSSDTSASRMKRVPSEALISGADGHAAAHGQPSPGAVCLRLDIEQSEHGGRGGFHVGFRPSGADRDMAKRGPKQSRRHAVDLVQLHHGREAGFDRRCGRCALRLGLAEFDDLRGDARAPRLVAGQRGEEARQRGRGRRVEIDLSGLFFDRDRGAFAAGQPAS